MIPPGSTIGVFGSGQLGRMFTMAAQSMGYRVAVLDPGDHSPAGTVADRHVRADYLDQQALYERFRLDEAWDSQHNKALLPLMPRTYAVPGGKDGKAINDGRLRHVYTTTISLRNRVW